MGLSSSGEITTDQIYEEIFGQAPTGEFTLEQLVQASSLADKSPPYDTNQFLGYNHYPFASSTSATNIDETLGSITYRFSFSLNHNNHAGFTLNYSITEDSIKTNYTYTVTSGVITFSFDITFSKSASSKIALMQIQSGSNYLVGTPDSRSVSIPAGTQA